MKMIQIQISKEEKEDCHGRHKARHVIKSYNKEHENKQNHTHIILYSWGVVVVSQRMSQ